MAIPTIILDLIKKRPDLLELGFSNEINERKLVRWLLKDGFREYPDLLKKLLYKETATWRFFYIYPNSFLFLKLALLKIFV